MKNVGIIYPFFAHYREAIIKELITNKEEVNYYFIAGDEKSKPYSSLKLYDFNNSNKFIKIKNIWLLKYFLIQIGIISTIKKLKLDSVVVLSDWKYLSHWYLIIYCKLNNIKILYWSHGLLNDKENINSKMKLFFHSLFDGGFVYSNYSKDIMENKGLKNISVIYNSLNLESQSNVLQKLENKSLTINKKIKLTKPYFIFSGRINLERNLEFMINAMSKFFNGDFQFLIIGNGEHISVLKALVNQHNLQNDVIFYGECYDENILGYYYYHSLGCVFPGPIGLTIIHSFSYGVPVLTNNNFDKQKPEIEALKEGVNGFLFIENNMDDFVEKLNILLKLNHNQRKFFSENALKEISLRYNSSVQKDIFNKVLKQ